MGRFIRTLTHRVQFKRPNVHQCYQAWVSFEKKLSTRLRTTKVAWSIETAKRWSIELSRGIKTCLQHPSGDVYAAVNSSAQITSRRKKRRHGPEIIATSEQHLKPQNEELISKDSLIAKLDIEPGTPANRVATRDLKVFTGRYKWVFKRRCKKMNRLLEWRCCVNHKHEKLRRWNNTVLRLSFCWVAPLLWYLRMRKGEALYCNS